MIEFISPKKYSCRFFLLLMPILIFSFGSSGCSSSRNADSPVGMSEGDFVKIPISTFSDQPETRLDDSDDSPIGMSEGDSVKIPLNTFPDRPEDERDIFKQYRIAPGDVLDVLFQANTWRQQDKFTLAVGNVVTLKFVHHSKLNQEQTIRPDGTISLPYLKEVHVTGKTVHQLTEELQNKYSEILKEPELYIVVPEFRNSIKELKQDLHTAPRGLSRLTTVRPDGYATFPMLGDIQVRGRAIPDVRQELDSEYTQIIPGLNVDLFLEKHAGRRIYVLGAVLKPGAYAISRPTTVAESLALAGSYLDSANLKQVVVMRREEDEMLGRFFNLKKALQLKKKGHFFYLRPDDIVYVPRRRLNRWATVAREIGDVIFFRGWSVGVSGSYELHDEGDSND